MYMHDMYMYVYIYIYIYFFFFFALLGEMSSASSTSLGSKYKKNRPRK